MNTRLRRLLSTLLVALLLFCQQMGFAHALTHLSNPTVPRPTRSDTQHPAEKACTECVLHAQLGSGLSSSIPAIAVAVVSERLACIEFIVFEPEFVPAFLSRAPPHAID